MKAIFYLAILFFSVISCSKNYDVKTTLPNVAGKWKQIEFYNSNGGSNPSWNVVANGYTIEFFSNGTFSSSKLTDCSTGKYVVSTTNEISMNYNCVSFTNNYVEKIETITNSQLILKPNYLNCDEGCSVKFERIN